MPWLKRSRNLPQSVMVPYFSCSFFFRQHTVCSAGYIKLPSQWPVLILCVALWKTHFSLTSRLYKRKLYKIPKPPHSPGFVTTREACVGGVGGDGVLQVGTSRVLTAFP